MRSSFVKHDKHQPGTRKLVNPQTRELVNL